MIVMLGLLTVFLVIGVLVSTVMVDRWSSMLDHYLPVGHHRDWYYEDLD